VTYLKNDHGRVSNRQEFNPEFQKTTKGAQAIDRAAEELTNLTSGLRGKAGAFKLIKQ